MSSPLTPFQMTMLPVIRGLIVGKPWLPASYVMAHVRIESGWDPAVKAGDFATTGSVGLMQVTAGVAYDRGFAGMDQADPHVSLATGIAQLAWGRNFLLQKWRFRSVKYHPVCEGYNEGYAGVVKGRVDGPYWLKWAAAQQGYAFVDADL